MFSFPESIQISEFLRDFWQKKPLFIPQGLPDFESPIDEEEIAGLACEETASARLVRQNVDGKKWQVEYGPFSEEEFMQLPSKDWILLIHNLEKELFEIAQWYEYFSFIPYWRIDDIMVSLASDQGSAGPRVDQYDLFLLQAEGEKRWLIGKPGKYNPDELEQADLHILKDFEVAQEVIAKPGDILYLPPGVPHHGISIGSSITYTVGFRAPSHRDLVASFMEQCYSQISETTLYTDPDIKVQKNPGEISPETVKIFGQLLHQYLDVQNHSLEDWLGRYLTEPKMVETEEYSCEITQDAFLQQFTEGNPLLRNAGIRAHFLTVESRPRFYVQGECIELAPEDDWFARFFCNQMTLIPEDFQARSPSKTAQFLLYQLYSQGAVDFYESV